jgi:hypothetical protein
MKLLDLEGNHIKTYPKRYDVLDEDTLANCIKKSGKGNITLSQEERELMEIEMLFIRLRKTLSGRNTYHLILGLPYNGIEVQNMRDGSRNKCLIFGNIRVNCPDLPIKIIKDIKPVNRNV